MMALKKYLPFLTVFLAAVVFILSCYLGLRSGKLAAQAEVAVNNFQQIRLANENFFADQEHYFSSAQFEDPGVMNYYIKPFPLPHVSSACPQDFQYQLTSAASYQLKVCLPVAIQNFSKGWNDFTWNK